MSLLLWPVRALWRLASALVGLVSRIVALVLGVVVTVLGLILSATIVGGAVGIPLILLGIVLIVRSFY